MIHKTWITTNTQQVCSQITGKEDFITIGELHNSRSAIQFIMENIEYLIPNDQRKNYFLTEFFPTGLNLIPNKINESNYLKAKISLSDKGKVITNDLNQCEADKYSNKEYTLENLYKLIFSRGVQIHSIEFQDVNSSDLYKKIQRGDISAYKERVEQVNHQAKRIANDIWSKDKNARLIIFAGMGHTANNKIKKLNGLGSCDEVTLEGIDQLLKGINSDRKGMSISIHDIDLCTDKDFLNGISTEAEGFTKYEIDDPCLAIDKPNFLLFTNTSSSQERKVIKKGFESIFLPNEVSFDVAKDQEQRKKILETILKSSLCLGASSSDDMKNIEKSPENPDLSSEINLKEVSKQAKKKAKKLRQKQKKVQAEKELIDKAPDKTMFFSTTTTTTTVTSDDLPTNECTPSSESNSGPRSCN